MVRIRGGEHGVGIHQLLSIDPTKFCKEQFYTIALSKLSNIGPVLGKSLLSYFGSAEEVFHARIRDWLGVQGIGLKTLSRVDRDASMREAEKETRFTEELGIKILTIYDDGYPNMLRGIYDAPLVLYQKGSADLNEKINIAIVGTRKPSTYGRAVSEQFSAYLTQKGFNIVSGLAYGVDISAHQAALNAGGGTTAVLGHGLGTVYPQCHSRQASAIVNQGSLLTEFSSAIGPEGRNFPMRNRIISGMCHATIVVEAGEKGGALITAKNAFEQNRAVYAIPGDLTRPGAAGTNKLIRDQIAKILLHPYEVMEDLGSMINGPVSKRGDDTALEGLEPEEKLIMQSLSQQAGNVSSLLHRLEVPFAKLKEILFSLELKNLVKQQAGGIYHISRI